MKALTLHIGAHKTGSTTMQAWLKANAGAFARGGVDLVMGAELTGTPLRRIHHVSQTPLPDETIERYTAEVARHLEADAASERAVLVSNENIVGRMLGLERSLYPHADQLFRLLAAIRDMVALRIVLFVRRQDTYVESTYTFRVRLGLPLSFAQYLRWLEPDRLSWLAIADRIEAHGLADRVTVVPYESVFKGREPDLNGAFARLFPGPEFDRVELRHLNPGIHRCVAQILRALRVNDRSVSGEDAIHLNVRIRAILDGIDAAALRAVGLDALTAAVAEAAREHAGRIHEVFAGRGIALQRSDARIIRLVVHDHLMSVAFGAAYEQFCPVLREDLLGRYRAENEELFRRPYVQAPGDVWAG